MARGHWAATRKGGGKAELLRCHLRNRKICDSLDCTKTYTSSNITRVRGILPVQHLCVDRGTKVRITYAGGAALGLDDKQSTFQIEF